MNNSAFLKNLKQLFSECDTDNNGSLGRQEFGELCKKIGLNAEAANETFVRLDIDKDGKISFDEFASGFNQYKQTATTPTNHPQQAQQKLTTKNDPPKHSNNGPIQTVSKDSDCDYADAQCSPVASSSRQVSPKPSPRQQHHQPSATSQRSERLTPSPISARAKKAGASQIGVLSLGSTGSASSGNLLATSSSSGGGASGGSLRSISMTTSGGSASLQSGASADTSWPVAGNSQQQQQDGGLVVYSGDHMIEPSTGHSDYDYYNEGYGQASGGSAGGGQFGSMLSNSSNSYSQVKTMQDLLECVQKLQNENQILTQIFFKDKREREEYISQLGEEFDQQLKEVEERANRRAREELENEKRRLQEMMTTERETLQNHYQTLEKISKMVRSPNGKLDDGESIDKVKSKLEDTFVENRQLKRSLLDTKTDVALIWKEMEKLKNQYEVKLSSAYEKHNETKSECDHIKQQLNLMKDSNRRLQDASDVITNYITDKVEPVINIANSDQDSNFLGPNTANSLSHGGQSSGRLAAMNNVSPGNSRRGSILSEYLNGGDDFDQQSNISDAMANENASSAGDLESMASSSRGGDKRGSSSLKPQQQPLRTSVSANQLSGSKQEAEITSNKSNDSPHKSNEVKKQQPQQQQQQQATPATTTTTTPPEAATTTTTTTSNQTSGIKNIGKHFFLGSRASSEAKLKDIADASEQNGKPTEVKTKSASADNVDEPSVEPADGPSKATFNIILVGDSFVGKSSFAARFMEGSFVQGLISNCSIDFKTKSYKVDGNNYTINLWDTAGQERFRSITASYFRKADGIILMYDVTDKRSYLNVRNWMSTISDTAAENVAVLLVGNKIDLRHNDNKYKCVPTEEGYRLAKEYEIVFLETSVKTGTNLLPSMGRLIRLIAKNNTEDEEEDKDRIRLNDKSKTFNCMPKNC